MLSCVIVFVIKSKKKTSLFKMLKASGNNPFISHPTLVTFKKRKQLMNIVDEHCTLEITH